MDPISVGAASGAQAAGSILGYMGQKETNQMNQAMAREQMAFQERMSSSAHQREVLDLQKAGLNPILSATGGSGASAPSGASSTAVNPGTFIGDGLSSMVNTGLSAANLEADLNTKNANVAKTLADTANTLETSKIIAEDIRGRRAANARSEGTLPHDISRASSEASTAFTQSQTAYQKQRQATMESKMMEADLPRAVEQSRQSKEYQKYDNLIQRVQSGIDTATSALNVSRYLRAPTVKAGTPQERRALERAGAKGLKVK